MFQIKKQALAALTLVASAPVWAATTADFNFYFAGGPVVDTISSAPTFNQGTIGVTIRAYNASGTLVSVANRFDGIGAFSGGLDSGDVTSSLLANPGERLELSFNQTVSLNSISMSGWDNTPLIGDNAKLSTGTTSLALSTGNDGGLLVKKFTLSSNPTGTVFNLQATGTTTAFRLAGMSVTAVPEVSTWAMMGLGLVGMGAVLRRRRT